MILYLGPTINELQQVPADVLENAVHELLRSHRLGHHLVVVDRKVASWILKNVTLSDPEAASLTRIASEYTQTADLVRRASVFVSITCDSVGRHSRRHNAVFVPLAEVARPYFLDRAVLAVEDSVSDGGIYALIFETRAFTPACLRLTGSYSTAEGTDLEL
jgi:KaiC/GvpD/RAD55 family RecA-like ATPase